MISTHSCWCWWLFWEPLQQADKCSKPTRNTTKRYSSKNSSSKITIKPYTDRNKPILVFLFASYKNIWIHVLKMLLTSLNIYFPAGAMTGDVKYTTDNAIASYISLLMSPICFVKYVLLKITREDPTSMTYLEPSQTFNMELFQELVNSFKPFIIFAKRSALDVWPSFEYASVSGKKVLQGDWFSCRLFFGRLILAWIYFFGCQIRNVYI